MSFSILPTCTGCTACVKVCPVGAICGERDQLHRIMPARCIDCGACGKICPHQAVLDNSAGLSQMVKRSQWPRPHILEQECIFCGVCLEVCPTGVLDFAELTDHQTRAVARLYHIQGCIGCSFCEAACPVGAIVMQNHVEHLTTTR